MSALKAIIRPFEGYNHPSINLKPTTINELESICGMFASKKAPGYYSIPTHVIKYSFHLISAPLADIINLSLVKGIFPDKPKILPIFKAEDLSFFVNYRTISLLSIIFKFFEKVIYNLLVELLKNMVYFTAVSLHFGKITRHRAR